MELSLTGTSLFVYAAVFVGVLVTFEGIRQLLARGENASEARNRRMKMMSGGASSQEVLQLLIDPEPFAAKKAGHPIKRLRRKLRQAGLRFGPGVLLLIMIVAVFALYSLLSNWLVQAASAPLAVLGGIGLPYAVINRMHNARVARLRAQLPDALDSIARGLQVGHPLSVTIENIARDMPDPIGTEFGLIQDQVAFGDDIVTAFHDFAERVDVEEVRHLAAAVGIQHGTGGNLARLLQVIAKVVRDRGTMRKKILAVSAEGRLSAAVLTFLPFGIFAAIHLSTPTFYGDVWDDPLFPTFMIAIIAGVVIQGLILYRLVNFRY